ncbi:hypothetical protein DUNSADRAFT_5697 [Dunaliella salina]|uniref:Encoded protein n=1 Tax=Dunaliella salina TaxID=3046 RepID=A0ABQ7FU42_DUNSA|nr:hypothetical protein DUNSADRAFT_5697 [Dunaliella salina]|eukprot:KAF5825949.1 hypothetical protein DUNSADRAFT_5697 [Dunaliella salina]
MYTPPPPFLLLPPSLSRAVGGLSDAVDPLVLSIPGRLSGAAVQDFELRPHIHGLLYQQGLLPSGATAATAAKIWAIVWADGEPKDRELVLRLLRSKTELQRAMATLLVLRHKLKAKVRA